MMQRLTWSIAIVVPLIAGCDGSSTIPPAEETFESEIPEPVKAALDQSAELELISLDPRYRDNAQPEEYLRRKVIGKTRVSDEETRRRILDALERGVRHVPTVPSCFDPRHAIAVKHEGKSIYLSICFQCNQVFVFVDGQNDVALRFYTSDTPEPVFDDVLKAAGVPLADKEAVLEEW